MKHFLLVFCPVSTANWRVALIITLEAGLYGPIRQDGELVEQEQEQDLELWSIEQLSWTVNSNFNLASSSSRTHSSSAEMDASGLVGDKWIRFSYSSDICSYSCTTQEPC